MAESIQGIVAASSVCEVFWTDPTGRLSAAGAVALWWDDAPVLAFTFASATRAREVASAAQVCLTLTESRSTGAAFTPVAVHGRATLVEDLEGDLFTEHLLTQELRRYPPSRAYADSLMLRRENWWYLPRLIVRVELGVVQPLAARSGPDDYVLAVAATQGRPRPLVTRIDPMHADTQVLLEPVGGDAVPDGPAVALGQDASFPDLEQWSTWTVRGHTADGRLVPSERPEESGLEPVPSLWQRIRFRRGFGRACRAGIAFAERKR